MFIHLYKKSQEFYIKYEKEINCTRILTSASYKIRIKRGMSETILNSKIM